MASLSSVNIPLLRKVLSSNLSCFNCRANHYSNSQNVYFDKHPRYSKIHQTQTIGIFKNINSFPNNFRSTADYNNFNYLHKSHIHTLFQTYVSVFQTVSESTAVTSTQNFLVNIHEASGLPWWSTIAISTFLLKSCITLPLALYQQYILAKIQNLNQELPAIAEELQKEVEMGVHLYKWSPDMAKKIYRKAMKQQWQLLIERDNCHPAKAGIVMLFQFPMWILFSMALRNLVSMRPYNDEVAVKVFDEFQHEGFLWVTNLTVPDGTMIIPCSLCLVSLSIIEVNRMMHSGEQTKFRKVITNISRFGALLSLPFGYVVPSCLSFYWLTSASFGLCQNLLVMSPKLKSLVGIPKTLTTCTNPYIHLWNQIQIRLKLKQSESSKPQ